MLNELYRVGLTSLLIVVCACDTPTEIGPVLQAAEWDGISINARVGDTFDLEGLMGMEIALASGGTPVAEIDFIAPSEGWLVTCVTSGQAQLQVRSEGVDYPQTITCREPTPISQFVGHWLNVSAYFGVSVGVGVAGNAVDLDSRAVQGGHELRCRAPGSYRYVLIWFPGGAQAKWYEFECRPGMPLAPIPEPRIGIPVNVAEAFREQDKVVQGLVISPADLADVIVLNANLTEIQSWGVDPTSAGHSILASEIGDIGLVCKKSGGGSMRVWLGPDDEPEYAFSCKEAHNQGGGG